MTAEDRKQLDYMFDAFMIISRGEYFSIYDVKNKITRYSPAAAELFGFGEYETNGADSWHARIYPEERLHFENVMADLLEGNLPGFDLSYRIKLKDGSYARTRNIGALIRNAEGKPNYIATVTLNEGLTENTDTITLLRNQYGFFQDLAAIIELKKKSALLLIGIGKMSVINDEHGYSYGNKILQHFAWFLQENFADSGTIYRLDGAKFAFITDSLNAATLKSKYEKIRRTMLGGLPVDDVRQILVLNGGMLTYDGAEVSERTIYACLARAFHDSKTRRNGKLVNYDGAIGLAARSSLELINEIRNCIVMDCEGFSLRYQPIVSAETEKIVAVEALLCWRNERFGDIAPNAYVPVLERDFLFEELGYWIFRQAMSDGKKILAYKPDFVMSINISPAQLIDEFLVEELIKISRKIDFPLKNICLELTASCRQIEPDILEKIIFALRAEGVRCLLDDFGTGVGSLEFLQSLKPDFIKPELKYIADIKTAPSHLQIVRHLTNMAVELQSNVCIKGIANAEIRNVIKEFPVKALQGNFYSAPLVFEDLMEKFFN